MLTSGGTIQGYNGQTLVDDKHQIIVHAEAFGSGQDAKHLEPMVDGSKANMQKIGQRADYFKGKILTADANYHNQGNLKKCHDEQIDAYIPDLKFRNRDSRFARRPKKKTKKGKKFVLEDFKHHKAADHYICPNGKVLKLNIKRHITDHNIYRRYMADEKDCAGCSLTQRCFYRKNTKRRSLDVPLGADKTNFSKLMQDKVDRRYCQMLCMALGGDPFFNNTINEFYSSDYFFKSFRMMQFNPPLLSTSAKLKSHG